MVEEAPEVFSESLLHILTTLSVLTVHQVQVLSALRVSLKLLSDVSSIFTDALQSVHQFSLCSGPSLE